MSICGIYIINNLVSEKIYIGQSRDIDKRFAEHKRNLKGQRHPNIHLQKSWNKHGITNFSFNLIEECTEADLNEKEIFYISEYEKITELYNLKEGGYNGGHSEESKKKMSESNKGHFVSDETKRKISEAHKGKTSPNKGKKATVEQKKKQSKAMKGRPGSWIGKTHSEESKRKISDAKKGHPPTSGMTGKKHSEESKKKIASAGIGRIPWNKGKLMSENNANKGSQ